MLFNRHTRVFLEQDDNVWEIPILPSYGFDVPVSVNTYTYDSVRAQRGNWDNRDTTTDITSKGPVTWNFTTYVRPFVANPLNDEYSNTDYTHHCVEEVLWAHLVAKNTFSNYSWEKGVTTSTDYLTIDFSESNTTKLNTFNLYFELGHNQSDTQIYKLENCCIDKASAKFSSSDIASITWSGLAESLETDGTHPEYGFYTEGKYSDLNYIVSKLSTLDILAHDEILFPGASGSGNYLMAVDDVDLEFNNNIATYMTNNISGLNIASSHLLGNREISGSFKAYLTLSTGSSKDLFKHLNEDVSTTNTFSLTFNLGGANVPKVVFEFPASQLIVPGVDFGEAININVSFKAKLSYTYGTESAIRYYGDITDLQHVPIEGTPSPSPSPSPSTSPSASPSPSPSSGEIMYPAGGETFNGYDTVNVSWYDHNQADAYLVQISYNGGTAWSPYNPGAADNTVYVPYYNLTLDNIATTNARIRVVSLADIGIWNILATEDTPNFTINQSQTYLDPDYLESDDYIEAP